MFGLARLAPWEVDVVSELTDRLRGIAGRATPGPWVVEDTYRVVRDMDVGTYHMAEMPQDLAGLRDVDYVSTFDPLLVGLMLDVIDAAEAHERVTHSTSSPSAHAMDMTQADSDLYDALARFREVAG